MYHQQAIYVCQYIMVYLAVLIAADHVIATTVLLDGHMTLGTLLGVGSYPVGGLAVIIALLDPLFEPLCTQTQILKS